MSVLGRPRVAAAVARAMQAVVSLAARRAPAGITIPTLVAPARAVVYLPPGDASQAPVHVNFHGGGYVLPMVQLDDPLCRFLAAEAGVVVLNVDYAVAPQHPFPAPPHQAFEIVRWVAEHGAEHGWDGGRLTVGGQSAGGGLTAAVARQALEQGGPPIALQILHYPVLDLSVPARAKRAAIPKPALRPWMGEVFDNSYVPDPAMRADPLVSPAGAADTADLTGIAPALVITAEFDLLHAEGVRYAERLRRAGALVEHRDLPGVDHGYDAKDHKTARDAYALMAEHIRRATREPG